MRIIGVIDLKNGRAVHARGGRRDEYAAVSEAAGTPIDGDAIKLAGVFVLRKMSLRITRSLFPIRGRTSLPEPARAGSCCSAVSPEWLRIQSRILLPL